MIKRSKISSLIFDVVRIICLVLLVVAIIYPFINIIFTSISDGKQVHYNEVTIFPRGVTLASYKELLSIPHITLTIMVSIKRVLVGVSTGLICNSFFAFILSQKEFKFRSFLNKFYIITMYFSGNFTSIYLLYRSLGLTGNFHVYWIPYLIVPYYMIIIKSYIKNIPNSLIDSAKLEGAGYLTIYYKVVLPIISPILGTVALFLFVDHWNSWFDVYLFSGLKREILTLQCELWRTISFSIVHCRATSSREYMGDVTSGLTLKAVVITACSLPIVIIYPLFQRYFLKGITPHNFRGY